MLFDLKLRKPSIKQLLSEIENANLHYRILKIIALKMLHTRISECIQKRDQRIIHWTIYFDQYKWKTENKWLAQNKLEENIKGNKKWTRKKIIKLKRYINESENRKRIDLINKPKFLKVFFSLKITKIAKSVTK